MEESESPPDEAPRDEGEGAAVEEAGGNAEATAEGEVGAEVSLGGEAEDSFGEEPADPADAGQGEAGEEESEVFVDGEDADPDGEDEDAGDGPGDDDEEADPAPSAEDGIIYTMTGEDSNPAGEGGSEGEAESGEDADPDPSEEDGIVYTMTGEEGSDPAGDSGDDGAASESGGGVPAEESEIILKPGEEADVRGPDGVLLYGQVFYMTNSAGGFGESEPRAADGPADYDRIEAMLAIRSEWPDLSSGACIA